MRAPLLQPSQALLFYTTLEENILVHGRSSGVQFIARTRQLLREILQSLTKNELQFFTTTFAQLEYVCDRYDIPQSLRDMLRTLHGVTGKKSRTQSKTIDENDITAIVYTLCEAITAFSGIAPPVTLEHHFQRGVISFSTSILRKPNDILPFVRAIVLSVGEVLQTSGTDHTEVLCYAEKYGSLQVTIYGDDAHIAEQLWRGATIHLFHCEYSAALNIVRTTRSSILVIEPDILLDVTSIAECYQHTGSEPLLYFLNKLAASHITPAMAIGTIINYVLDEILQQRQQHGSILGEIQSDIEVSKGELRRIVRTMIDNAVRAKPLMYLCAFPKVENGSISHLIDDEVMESIERIVSVLTTLDSAVLTTEPSYISPLYGIQGRLDILAEYDDDTKRKTIIELKSGSAPKPQYSYKTDADRTIPSGMWSNHLAQVTCYNLLLETAYSGRKGDSQVLYSRATEHPLRNAPNITQLKQDVVRTRNRIIILERQLMLRNFRMLQKLHPATMRVPSYMQNQLEEFSALYRTCTQLDRMYFQAMYAFLLREHNSQRIGLESNSSNGFARLWRESISEKIETYSILSSLVIDHIRSDFANLRLTLLFTESTPPISTFRVGDIAILYAMNSDGSVLPYQGLIIKCSIRSITNSNITISVRNKQLRVDIFTQSEQWVLEPDYIESSFNAQYSSLATWLHIDQDKRNALLGLRSARKFDTLTEQDDYRHVDGLSEQQQLLLRAMLNSQEYYLLQGPPGTGKTSVMMKNLVEQLATNPNETILITAYTNRAIDEICAALKRIENLTFLRMGSNENTTHTSDTLSTLVHTTSWDIVQQKVQSTRVLVATTTFLHTNPELFTLWNITTAIFDEAAQMVEASVIGLVAKVGRWIMIGDEKQLPAVVTQSDFSAKVHHPLFEQIALGDMRMSMFERLLRLCIANNWTHSYGMLSRQGRMHTDIGEFISQEFYDNTLLPINDWQNTDSSPLRDTFLRSTTLPSHVHTALLEHRLCFIPSDREHATKSHTQEAERIALIAETLAQGFGDALTEHSIGIITPFRVQIREIVSRLPEHLRLIITVDTVERFQGSERDVILLSCSVSHLGSFSALQSIVNFNNTIVDRKLNVALTRARHHCIILGCEEILTTSHQYSRLIEFIRLRGGYCQWT